MTALCLFLALPVLASEPVPPVAGEKPAAYKSEPLLVDDVSIATPTAKIGVHLVVPAPPAHRKPSLNSAADVAADLAEVLRFLDQGQTYYAWFTSGGSHSTAENKAFVAFLQDYERELGYAKQELHVLRTWVDQKSALKKD